MPYQDFWSELDDSPRENVSRNGVSVVRNFRGPWQDRFNFAQRLFEEAPVYTPIPDAQLSGIDFTPMECVEKNAGADVVLEINEFKSCICTVSYEIDYTQLESDSDLLKGSSNGGSFTEDASDGYYTIDIEGATVDYTVEGESWEWLYNKKASLSVDTNPYIQIPTTNFTLSLHQAVNPDWQGYSRAVKHVNQSSFTIPVLGIRCPSETLLFDSFRNSVEVDKSSLINRTVNWKVEFDFKYRYFVAPIYKGIYTQGGDQPTDVSSVANPREKAKIYVSWNHYWNDKVKEAAWEYVLHPTAKQEFTSEISGKDLLTPVPIYPFGRVF